MHLLRPLRALGLVVAGVTAAIALWVATSPPATSTVAPSCLGVP
jgi:hypothetical protein